MANLTGLVTFTTNTVISSADMNSNFSAITTVCNTTDGGYASKTGTETITNKVFGSGSGGCMPPVGTILAHYDFNAAVSINTSYFAYCDGSVISNASSPINGQTLPDLSNRYLVGFGTEGGGDIDSATWATAAVGNASHQVDLGHTHGAGTLQFKTMYCSSLREYQIFESDGTPKTTGNAFTNYGNGGLQAHACSVSSNYYGYTKDGTGSTASSGLETQSIQPRSVRVRWIMRIV